MKPTGSSPMPRTAKRRILTPQQADRAVWIDFEGFANASPTLIGVLIDGVLEQVVLEPLLAEAARAKGLRLSTLRQEVDRLVALCRAEGRVLVAYSRHELKVIRDHCGLDVSDIYRDALKIAKRWWRRTHPGRPLEDRSLNAILALVGHPVPPHLGERKTTHRLRGVLAGLAAKGTYDALTPVVKAKWTKLLEHNASDCRGMELLVQLAVSNGAGPSAGGASVRRLPR